MLKLIDISKPLTAATPVFPGDVPFSRDWTAMMERGDSCNVSEVRGSAHAGTHIDLPLHFGSDRSEPPLENYIGPATVIDAREWDALPPLPKSTRLIFRAHDHPPTPKALRRIVEAGAPLLGVDLQSVDPLDSKDLPNHHTLANAGVAILENLELIHVQPGDYELIALPLIQPGADATWVRAVLLSR